MPVKYKGILIVIFGILHSLSIDEIQSCVLGNSSVIKIYIIRPNWDQLRKMQLQGLLAGNRTRVLWITRPVLYH